MSNYYFVRDCTEPEMIVAKSFYEWQKLEKHEEYFVCDSIYMLYDHLKRNKHLLRGNDEENTN